MRLALAVLALWLGAGPAAADAALGRINAALRAWVTAIQSDRPYLVLDGAAGYLRLEHGGALLRQCDLVDLRLTEGLGPRLTLERKLRSYRPSFAGSRPTAGPFDWEQHLATDGYDRCALYFDKGLLLFADAVWAVAAPPRLRLQAADLRALYNAVDSTTVLVILPEGWKNADKPKD